MNQKDIFIEELKRRTKKFVVEETDESLFWLEVIDDSKLSTDQVEHDRLLNECTEIVKIVTKAKDTTYKNINH